MMVIIGIDPHKASHTAVAIDEHEQRLGELRVAAERGQTQRLLAWAAPFEERAWAVESADGLGKLLSQQLVAECEYVIDVPPTLAARVRLLGSTKAGKSDPNDTLSTAIAGLRHGGLRRVVADDDRVVLRLLVRRFGDVTAARTRAVCRLHAVLIEPSPVVCPANSRLTRPPLRCARFDPTTPSTPPAAPWPSTSAPNCAATTANSRTSANASLRRSRTPERRCSRRSGSARSSPH